MLKPDQNPCGLFIQGQGMGDGEMADTIEHIARANYSTVSVMNNFGLCSRIKDRVPDCDVVYRASGFEPKPTADNKKVMAEYLKITPLDKRIRLMANCENGFSADRVKAACDYIDVLNDNGWKGCLLNTGSGTVRSGQLKGDGTHEANEWLTVGAPLLHKLAENPDQGVGYHNYTSVFAWIVANGTYMFQQHDKPPIIDWSLAQWHMGRDLQGIAAACDALGIALPLMFVTECWVDQMNDIQENPANPYHTYKSNRWRNLIEPWKLLYPGQEAEDILADQFYWSWENVFARFGRGRVVGMHFFTWLSSALANNEWKDDDVANAPKFRKRQEAYRPKPVTSPPATTYPPLPAADDPRWLKVIAVAQGNVNLRVLPDKAGSILVLIKPGQELSVLPAEAHGIWCPAKIPDGINEMRGWVSTDVIGFKEVPAPPPPSRTLELSRADVQELHDLYQGLADKYADFLNR